MEKGSLKFLVDENISPKLVTILNKLGERSVYSLHREDAYRGQDDEVWLPLASQRGFICVTCDCQMLCDQGIATVLRDSQATVIFLASNFARSRTWDQALWLLRHWRKIKAFAEGMRPGQLVKVYQNGRIAPVRADGVQRRRRRSNGQAGA